MRMVEKVDVVNKDVRFRTQGKPSGYVADADVMDLKFSAFTRMAHRVFLYFDANSIRENSCNSWLNMKTQSKVCK